MAQYAGRLHRRHLGKVEVRIHDYSDGNVAVLGRMLEKRLRAYRAVGYTVEPSAHASAPRETTVEYDVVS